MKYGFDEYLELLTRLSPLGRIWRLSKRWGQVLEALAEEIARASSRVEDLMTEGQPAGATSTGLLDEWLDALGLPDECTGEATAEAAAAKMVRVAGSRPADMLELLVRLGCTSCTLTEIPASGAGAPAGVPATEYGFAFVVDNPEAVTVTYADVDNADCDDPLEWWGNKILECAVNRAKPAHTSAWFTYPNAVT